MRFTDAFLDWKHAMGSLEIAICLCLQLVVLHGPATADEWPSPQEMVHFSRNGLYSVRILPGNSTGDTIGFAGARKGEYARAVLRGPEIRGELTFTLLNPVAPVEAILLDDGSMITFDNWHNMGYGKVMVLYDRAGQVRWSHELQSLLSADVRRLVPQSVSSRWWRRHPLEWRLEERGWVLRRPLITLTLWNEDRLRVRVTDGRVEYVPVKDPGDDPKRLLNRGQALVTQESYGVAVAAFKRAIGLDPRLVQAYTGLAEAYGRQEDYPKAIAALQEGIRQNPASGRVSSEGGLQGDPRIWLHLELARTYEQAGSLREAEESLQECLRLDPGFWEAGKTLAVLWLRNNRATEADALLAKFFALKKGVPGQWDSGYKLSSASLDVGSFYADRHDYGKARAYYLKAYDQGDVNPFLYERLAVAHEKLGEYRKAVDVLEKLKMWMQNQRGYEGQLKRLEGDIVRLRSPISNKSDPHDAVGERRECEMATMVDDRFRNLGLNESLLTG